MTIFTKIIKGIIPSYKVYEDDRFFAFLDIKPLREGHTLLVPKLCEPEEDYIFRLDDETLSLMIRVAKKIAVGIEKAVSCKRVGMAVLGLEVNHVHIHLIPIDSESDMLFSKERLEFSDEQMCAISRRIRESIGV